MTSRHVPLLAAILLSACSTWTLQPTPLPSGRSSTIQIWNGDTSFVVRHAMIDGDTLAGSVRTGRSDSTGMRLLWSTVDSVRVRRFDGIKTFIGVTTSLAALISTVQVLDPTPDFEF